jgi:hypothetical protein
MPHNVNRSVVAAGCRTVASVDDGRTSPSDRATEGSGQPRARSAQSGRCSLERGAPLATVPSMGPNHVAAAVVVALSGALLTASCARSQTPTLADPPAIETQDEGDPFGAQDVGVGIGSQQCEPDDQPNLTSAEDGPTGEAQQPWIGLAARLTCQLVAVLITEHVCHKVGYWETHCPEGTYIIVHDLKPSTMSARVSCDTVKELTCGTGAFAIDRLARMVFCGRVF